jgi:hypothetical protein
MSGKTSVAVKIFGPRERVKECEGEDNYLGTEHVLLGIEGKRREGRQDTG